MSNKTFIDWIQIAGNLGLIAGLILVAVQIRDSNRIASAEMFSASVESSIAVNTAQFGDSAHESMTRVLYTPTEATVEDLYIADRVYDALFRLLVRVLVFEELEVYGSQQITSQGFVTTHYEAFACPYGLSWLDQALTRLRDAAAPDAPEAPIVSALELVKKLAREHPAESDFSTRQAFARKLIAEVADQSLLPGRD